MVVLENHARIPAGLSSDGKNLTTITSVDGDINTPSIVVEKGAVFNGNLSMGKGGVLQAEVASALYGRPDAPPILMSFVGGLGGRDISPEELYEIAAETRKAAEDGRTPPPRLLYTRDELREIRKLQAVAQVERNELEPGQ